MKEASDPRLTVVVARRIHAGREGEYESLMRDFVAWSLARPGHQGLHILRPPPEERDYTVVSRFSDEAARRAYTDSPEYRQWMTRLAPLTDGDPRIQELTGLEGLVTMPGHELQRSPTWKLAIATFLGVLPTSLFLEQVLLPRLSALPWVFRSTLFAAAMVAMLSWIIMPLVTRALHKWLFPERAGKSDT